jgi:hypothetical protein
MIFLPDSKTGRKPVYLNAPALEVLEKLPRQLGNPHVVCGRRDGSAYAGLHKVWCRVRTAAALSGVRLHDLRHSFASIGAAGNNSLLILGKLLGHRHAATTERYSHLSADPMRQAAEAIGRRISTALAGESDPSDTNVRRLRGARDGRPKVRRGWNRSERGAAGRGAPNTGSGPARTCREHMPDNSNTPLACRAENQPLIKAINDTDSG